MVDALYELDGEADTESDAMDEQDNEEVEKVLRNSFPKAVNGAQTNGHPTLKQQTVESAVPQKEKIDWEIPRKLLHSSIGFITLYGYITNSDVPRVMIFLWSALAIIIPADLLRFRSRQFERTYERALGFLMRESEKNSVNGVVWYILGVNFVLTFYPIDIATVAILILSWADTAASTIGRLFGSSSPRLPARLPILRLPFAPRKSLAGFMAASITGACITIGFWGWIAHMREGDAASWVWNEGVRLGSDTASCQWIGGWTGLGIIGVAAGLVSGVAEALDLGSLDDNLTLPVISGGCIYGFFKLLQIIF